MLICPPDFTLSTARNLFQHQLRRISVRHECSRILQPLSVPSYNMYACVSSDANCKTSILLPSRGDCKQAGGALPSRLSARPGMRGSASSAGMPVAHPKHCCSQVADSGRNSCTFSSYLRFRHRGSCSGYMRGDSICMDGVRRCHHTAIS